MALTFEHVSKGTFSAAIETLRSDFESYLSADASQFKVLKSMASALEESEGGDQYIIGRDTSVIVALMMISGGMSKKIDELAAKQGNGSKMVEYAMTYCKGRAVLDSFDKDSTSFWTKMGFVKYAELPAQQAQGGCKMKLACATSSIWETDGTAWRIARPAALPPGFGPREPQPYSNLGVGRKESVN